MATKFAETDLVVDKSLSQQLGGLSSDPASHAARLSTLETMPYLASKEYKVLYLPTMLSVFTARHQQMPASNESLREHIFGSDGHAGCEACREETEFLVAHQKKFF